MRKSLIIFASIFTVNFYCSIFSQEKINNCLSGIRSGLKNLNQEDAKQILKIEALGLGAFYVTTIANTFFHELGHAAAARSVGCEITKIYVDPFSGSGYCGHTRIPYPHTVAKNIYIRSCGPMAGMLCSYACAKHILTISKQEDYEYIPREVLFGSYTANLCSTMNNAINLVPFKKKPNQDGSRILADINYLSKVTYKNITPKLYYTTSYSLLMGTLLYGANSFYQNEYIDNIFFTKKS